MKLGKTIYELYNVLLENDEAKFAKHDVCALILGALDNLETSGTPITPESIEEALKKELKGFELPSLQKKAS